MADDLHDENNSFCGKQCLMVFNACFQNLITFGFQKIFTLLVILVPRVFILLMILLTYLHVMHLSVIIFLICVTRQMILSFSVIFLLSVLCRNSDMIR